MTISHVFYSRFFLIPLKYIFLVLRFTEIGLMKMSSSSSVEVLFRFWFWIAEDKQDAA